MKRHELIDQEWAVLEPLLPKRSHTGRPPKDYRTFLNALLWLARTGAPWRDLPERFGPWQTVATRFYRWTGSGIWERILAELRRVADVCGGIDWEVHMIDGKPCSIASRSSTCYSLTALNLHLPDRSSLVLKLTTAAPATEVQSITEVAGDALQRAYYMIAGDLRREAWKKLSY